VVLNAAQKYDKRILIASTSEIYGKNTKQPLSETDDRVIGTPQKLRWTYSDAKALEEATAYSLFLTKKLRVTTVRFFNTVGPRQTGRYGMVLPRFVKSALRNEPIIIYGDGKQSRVFCHVNDAVKAILMIVNSSESIGEVYNVGGVGEVSILDLAQKIKSVLNSESRITYLPYGDAYPPGFEDMRRRVPDISKITQQFNWRPENALDKIISDVADSLIKKT
jgi:UDP-glucose 4-epimerase